MSIKPKDLNLGTIAKRFSDEGEAYRFLESIRWPDGQVCPHCGSIGHAYFLNPKGGMRITRTGKTSARRVWKCGDCRKQFSVLIGTIFEGSHIPLFKWLLAFHMLASAKNGIAAYELHRTLHISGESAWFMAHRIRYALEAEQLFGTLTGTVEADETYFGGEAKNMHKADRERRIRGRGPSGKTPVVSLVERGGRVRSQVVADVSGKTLGAVLRQRADTSAVLMTDTAGAYGEVGREFASHQTVNHSAGEYVHGDVHTNTAEGYFSQLKRSIDGTHHHVSEHHLHRYLSEFDFRYNTRKMRDGERMIKAIEQTTGKRLEYA
ncbi:MAG: IS1595 family transposase [Chloroflexi bacterium]|nr:IS1595 family transposase [Chloroflexota bacterium]